MKQKKKLIHSISSSIHLKVTLGISINIRKIKNLNNFILKGRLIRNLLNCLILPSMLTLSILMGLLSQHMMMKWFILISIKKDLIILMEKIALKIWNNHLTRIWILWQQMHLDKAIQPEPSLVWKCSDIERIMLEERWKISVILLLPMALISILNSKLIQ